MLDFVFRHYRSPIRTRYSEYDELILFIMLVTSLLLLLLLRYCKDRYKKRQNKRNKKFETNLKDKGVKLIISTDKCTVITKKYTIPNPYLKKLSRPSMMDYLTDKINYDEYIEVKECYIECDIEVDNVEKYFKSKAIKMDTKALEIKLYLKKEITIYYDSSTEEYFFDLDFLYD